VADIWGFGESMEKPIRVHGKKPQISTTAKVRRKSTLRERLQETPEPHSRGPIISSGLIEKLLKKSVMLGGKTSSGGEYNG